MNGGYIDKQGQQYLYSSHTVLSFNPLNMVILMLQAVLQKATLRGEEGAVSQQDLSSLLSTVSVTARKVVGPGSMAPTKEADQVSCNGQLYSALQRISTPRVKKVS